jgi:hypothetical protein
MFIAPLPTTAEGKRKELCVLLAIVFLLAKRKKDGAGKLRKAFIGWETGGLC